jgi:glyoxylase-like metal-dependent hydrolase (beta-lactamase superfamily II)
VFYPGRGHSADNLVVWLGSGKILFGTCAVRSPTFSGKGNTADASLDEWPESIRSVRARYPEARVVVPGHGPVGSTDLLDHTIALFDAPDSAEE